MDPLSALEALDLAQVRLELPAGEMHALERVARRQGITPDELLRRVACRELGLNSAGILGTAALPRP